MSKKIILVQIFIIIFAFGVFTQSNAQGGVSAGVSIPRPIDEAEIEGKIPDYEIKETGLEYLQSLPMPEVKFVFKSKSIGNDELPEDVKTILMDYWKQAIKFWHTDTFDKAKGQIGYDRDVAWMIYNNKTENKLQELFIEAPNGKRKISQTEAGDLWSFLNSAAIKVIKKTESIK